MNKNMNLPAEYAVLSEEEMTYTQGGSDIGGFPLPLRSWVLWCWVPAISGAFPLPRTG
jgi:hypothetical protein